MADDAKEGQRHGVGCPFCGLVCDDLTVDVDAGRPRVVQGGCAISRRRFAASAPAAAPLVDGRPAELAAAVARAATILGAAVAPLFVVAADVAGTRAALRLADRLGGVIDHPGSAALFRALRPLQDSGALTTTLSEVRNRADLVLIVGPDPTPLLPRLFELCLAPRATLFEASLERRIFRLGPPGEASPSVPVSGIDCAMTDLPEAVAVLAAMLRGTKGVAGDARFADLADRLKTARYAVLLWAPPLVEAPFAELLGAALLELARDLGRSQRCVVLPVGGNANLFGVNQVTTWQSGYPIRTGFGAGVPEHDPYRFSAERMLEAGEADALVWASSLDERAPPAGAPTILLAPPAAAEAGAGAAVYIPVGTPGIDHPGQVFRADGVVSLRLGSVRRSMLPDVASVLAQVEARLAPGGAAA